LIFTKVDAKIMPREVTPMSYDLTSCVLQ